MPSSYFITQIDLRQSHSLSTHSPLSGSAAGREKGGGARNKCEPCEVDAVSIERLKMESELKSLASGCCSRYAFDLVLLRLSRAGTR